MLLDSNIIIYAAKPEHDELRRLIVEQAPAVSAVSAVEVLGYHRLTDDDRQHFEAFFAAATVLPISGAVVSQAIKLRQIKKMTLGDALIAGTALVSGRTLVTRNTTDFEWVAGLKLLNPFGNN
ncbi:MAG: type II toxin-antitoxin system VapC family toxin [Gemmataceae bacterium]|nr:type II toxin-antitoxin system VapC family toxin [Gemmataceae bacterium]